MPHRPLRYDPARDYYALLGVTPAASSGEIQRAFRQRAKQLHPDRNPDRPDWAKEAFQAINEAYGVLGDPERRREYDSLRRPHAARGQWTAESYRADKPWWDVSPAGGVAPPGSSPSPSAGPDGAWKADAWRYPPGRIETRGAIQALWALLRGPYGGVLRLTLVLCLLLPLSYTAITLTVSHVVAVATPTLPASGAAALATCGNPAVTITSPAEGDILPARFDVSGSADDPAFAVYWLEIASLGAANAARTWAALGSPTRQPVRNGTLLRDASLGARPAGMYLLRLTVWRIDGTALPPCERRVFYRP